MSMSTELRQLGAFVMSCIPLVPAHAPSAPHVIYWTVLVVFSDTRSFNAVFSLYRLRAHSVEIEQLAALQLAESGLFAGYRIPVLTTDA